MAKDSDAARVHRTATVIDMVCPLIVREPYIDEWVRGGATAAGATVAADHTLVETMGEITMWYERFQRLGDRILHVTRVEDIARAKKEGKLGVIFHFQNTQPFERIWGGREWLFGHSGSLASRPEVPKGSLFEPVGSDEPV